MPSSKTVQDWGPSSELFAAFGLLCHVQQSDFYLRHLMHRLAEHLGAEPPASQDSVTGEVTLTHVLKSRSEEQRWGVDDEVEPENPLGLWITVAILGITLFIGAFWYVVSH